MQYVIIVNGKPESGKTIFESMCMNTIEECNYGNACVRSSIDPIKEICKLLGWDGKKTEKWRKIMHYLKTIWIEACNGPTKYIVDGVLKDRYSNVVNGNVFYFVDIREPSEIKKLYDTLYGLHMLDIKCITVLITREETDSKVHENDADGDMITNYDYDYHICNDSPKSALYETVSSFIKYILSV